MSPHSPSTHHPLHQVLVPTVIEEGNRGDRAFDIYSQLLRERIVFLGQEVDDQVANLIAAATGRRASRRGAANGPPRQLLGGATAPGLHRTRDRAR